ncbi:hypothetical protein PG994_003885 [Apiospora phragmitis]|uniref:Uncharacterized protein n=1 Tax=Apiospora phragmitis TaxID=2905665 RepID=A0ABR1VZH6_9PEZI
MVWEHKSHKYQIGVIVVYRESFITALLVTIVQAGSFLSPWSAGPTKDYSKNKQYSIGTNIILERSLNGGASFELQLWQENYPTDAQGGPHVSLETTTHYFNITGSETPTSSSTSTTVTSSSSLPNTLASGSTLPPSATETVWQTASAEAHASASDESLETGTLVGGGPAPLRGGGVVGGTSLEEEEEAGERRPALGGGQHRCGW